MTPAERGQRLGKIAAWVVPFASAAIGASVGVAFRDSVAWQVGPVGVCAIVAFVVFARRELRIVEREEAAERTPKTPEQIGEDVYRLTRSPLVLHIELNQEGRAALMRLAASKRLPVEQAYLYAARIVAEGGGEIRR